MSADCTNKKRSYANRRILEVQFKNQYARAFSEAHHLLLTNNEIPGYFFHSWRFARRLPYDQGCPSEGLPTPAAHRAANGRQLIADRFGQ